MGMKDLHLQLCLQLLVGLGELILVLGEKTEGFVEVFETCLRGCVKTLVQFFLSFKFHS